MRRLFFVLGTLVLAAQLRVTRLLSLHILSQYRAVSLDIDNAIGIERAYGYYNNTAMEYGLEIDFQGLVEHSQYPWNDIKWPMDDKSKIRDCGWVKCYFPSKKKKNKGYLIASLIGSRDYRHMKNGYRTARNLKRKFGSRHLYRKAPVTVNVSGIWIQFLNERVIDVATLSERIKHVKDTRRYFDPSGITSVKGNAAVLAVQEVTRAPYPNLLIATKPSKIDAILEREIPLFAKRFISNRTAFTEQFKWEIERLSNVLQEYQTLMWDFQGLVDKHGVFYHIDLDGTRRKDIENQTQFEISFNWTMSSLYTMADALDKEYH